jgi:lysyl-tRNA synthetase class 2
VFPKKYFEDIQLTLSQFLTDNYSIKEVLTFPFMKDVVEEKSKTAAEVVNVEAKPAEGIAHK